MFDIDPDIGELVEAFYRLSPCEEIRESVFKATQFLLLIDRVSRNSTSLNTYNANFTHKTLDSANTPSTVRSLPSRRFYGVINIGLPQIPPSTPTTHQSSNRTTPPPNLHTNDKVAGTLSVNFYAFPNITTPPQAHDTPAFVSEHSAGHSSIDSTTTPAFTNHPNSHRSVESISQRVGVAVNQHHDSLFSVHGKSTIIQLRHHIIPLCFQIRGMPIHLEHFQKNPHLTKPDGQSRHKIMALVQNLQGRILDFRAVAST